MKYLPDSDRLSPYHLPHERLDPGDENIPGIVLNGVLPAPDTQRCVALDLRKMLQDSRGHLVWLRALEEEARIEILQDLPGAAHRRAQYRRPARECLNVDQAEAFETTGG